MSRAALGARRSVGGRARADALAAYDALPANAFQPYISLLAKDFSPAPISIAAAAAAYAMIRRRITWSRCSAPSNRRARNCSAASTWRLAPPRRLSTCGAGCCAS